MNTEIKLKVTDVQRFCMHDGPGVRTTVFLKGCPLRCHWCHNPETQSPRDEIMLYADKCIHCNACVSVCPQNAHLLDENGHTVMREKCTPCGRCADICPTGAVEICGKDMTVKELINAVERDRAFYGENGGVTLSGGEPFVQGEKTVALLKALKKSGFTTAVETCGYSDKDVIISAAPYVNLFLWDVKDTDDGRHKKHTGVSNRLILDNLNAVGESGARIRLRCILINGINTEITHYERIADIAISLKNCEGVEIIPYHAYGGSKSVYIGGKDNGKREWIPSAKQIAEFKAALKERGATVI